MKRLLSLIVVLFVLVGSLVSCDLVSNIKLPWNKVEETDIQEAVKELDDIYSDANGSATTNDYELIAQLKIDGTVFNIAWTTDSDLIKLELVGGYWSVTVPTDAKEQVEYKLIATITTEGGQSASIEFNRIIPQGGMGMITEPQIGGTYKLAVLHGGVNKFLFFRGEANKPSTPWYLGTTDDVLSAVDVTLEAVDGVEGAFRLAFEFDGEKKYLRTYPRDGAGYENAGTIELTTECPAEYYTYDSEHNAIVWDHTNGNGAKSFLCCSGTFETIQSSDYNQYIESESTYIAFFYGAGGVEVKLPELVLPEVPENYTDLDIINALYQLKPGQTLEGPYYLTGVVTSIKTAYDPAYGNVSFNIKVAGAEDKPVLIYRIKGEGLVDLVKPGDTVKVFVGLTNYGGTFETTAGGQIIELIPGDPVDDPTDNPQTPPSEGAASLDLVGSANKVSADANQIVFSQNGITYTCDKAESSSDLVVQESYAQRAYKGSTVKIEYPGMTKIVITFDDYESNGKTYMAGFDGMTVEGATFTRENDVLTIYLSAASNVFQSAPLASQVRIEKIEVYTGEVEQPGTDEPGTDEPGTDEPTEGAIVAGKAYDLYMELPSGKVYFAGALDQGKYLATTTDASAAVKISFEAVDGGYNIYFMNGETKTYINAEPYLKSNGYAGCHFTLGETATTTWTYDAKVGVLEVYGEVEGKSDTFFAGTYGTYSTVSLSGAYYKDQIASGTQYPARIVLAEGGEDTPVDPQPPVHEHNFVEGKCECGETDPNYQPPSEDGDETYETITIPEALEIAKGYASNEYSTEKYYITGTVSGLYNTTYGNFYLKDENGKEICIYGLYNEDGSVRYDAMSYKPVNGDVVTVYTALGCYNTTYQGKNAWLVEVTPHTHDYESKVTNPTCNNEGYTTHTCKICDDNYVDTTVDALGHTTDNGECERCGLTIGGSAPVIGEIVRFDFGANGSAAHVDGNDYGTAKSFTEGSHTLDLTGMSKVFGTAYDAKGNSCIKLGTSSKTGAFSFTVGENVTEVVIYVAKYKANTTKISVNGTQYTISGASNDGAYDAIVIDTTVTKTIKFETVSGGVRCMIDAIVFNGVVA